MFLGRNPDASGVPYSWCLYSNWLHLYYKKLATFTWIVLHDVIDHFADSQQHGDLLLRGVQFDHGLELVLDFLYGHGVWGQCVRHAQFLRMLRLGQRQVILQLLPLPAPHLELLQGCPHHPFEGLQDALEQGLLQDSVWGEEEWSCLWTPSKRVDLISLRKRPQTLELAS